MKGEEVPIMNYFYKSFAENISPILRKICDESKRYSPHYA